MHQIFCNILNFMIDNKGAIAETAVTFTVLPHVEIWAKISLRNRI